MTPLLVVLLVLVLEAAREAFSPDLSVERPRGWAARHYRRMRPIVPPSVLADPEFTFWSKRQTRSERARVALKNKSR